MVDELRLNTKLIGFDGIIGRWDFCLNFVYLCMIGTLFSIPASGYLMSHIGNFGEFFSMNAIFWEAPWLLKLWVLPGMAFVLYIGVSLIVRRLNDINGSVSRDTNTIVSVLYALSTFGLLFPVGISVLLYLLNLVILLYMIIAKGKITGKYPYDYRKEFNWGAFFGTWIWGLFNKSYKTLWMLVLWLTPWGFWYALVCGFKGNEWAAKNRDWQNLEEFQKSQETQTIVFVILSVLIIPIIYFLIVMAIIGAIVFTAVDEAKTSPEHKSTTLEKLDSAINSFGSLYFDSYEITADENKLSTLQFTIQVTEENTGDKKASDPTENYVTLPQNGDEFTKTATELGFASDDLSGELVLEWGWGTKFGSKDPCEFYNDGHESNLQTIVSEMEAFETAVNGATFKVTISVADAPSA